MGQNKEQLKKLLAFIKQLVDEPGNEDFARDLRNMLGVSTISEDNNSKISDIEKYLGLDYMIDGIKSIIDYSFVNDEFVRQQLISDNREMLRYRLGLRSHKVDFAEFCRYALLQTEMLLNYFYSIHFKDDITAIKANIKANFEKANVENAQTLMGISLFIKLLCYGKEYDLGNARGTLDMVREVRNEQSHRKPDEDKKFVEQMRNYLQSVGYSLWNNGEVNWGALERDTPLYDNYYKVLNNSPEYKRYKFCLWKSREPFNEVLYALNELAISVKANLQK